MLTSFLAVFRGSSGASTAAPLTDTAALLPPRVQGQFTGLLNPSRDGATSCDDLDDGNDSAALYEKAVQRAQDAFGPESEQTLAAVKHLAHKLTRDGEPARACPVWHRCAELDSRLHGTESAAALDTLYGYAAALTQAGDVVGAERSFRLLAAHLQARFGLTHAVTLRAIAGHALALQNAGRHEESAVLFDVLVRHRTHLYDSASLEHDPAALTALAGLASSQWKRGLLKDAEELLVRVAKGRDASLGPEAPDTLRALHSLGAVLIDAGRHVEAEGILSAGRRVVCTLERRLRPGHPEFLNVATDLASAMGSQGLHAGAAELLWRVYAARLKSQGPQHPETLATARNLAVALFDQAQTPPKPLTTAPIGTSARSLLRQAEGLLRDTLPACIATLGVTHLQTLSTMRLAAVVAAQLGRPAEAEPLLRRVRLTAPPGLPASRALVLQASLSLAAVLVRLAEPGVESAHPPASRLLEALALLEESAAGLMAQARPDMAAVAGARQQAVAVRCALDRLSVLH